jgi:cellulose biosynthesis protein BcsQ
LYLAEKIMSVPILTFFNNRGVGETSLVYHLAWMFTDLGKQIIVADLDNWKTTRRAGSIRISNCRLEKWNRSGRTSPSSKNNEISCPSGKAARA